MYGKYLVRRHPADGPVSGHRQVRESVENERDAFRATRSTFRLKAARGMTRLSLREAGRAFHQMIAYCC